MNGGEKILNRIKSDCDKNVEAILSEANEECKAITEQAEIQAKKSADAVSDKAKAKVEQIKKSSKSRAELEIRNRILKQRRIEIDKTIDELLKYLLNLNDDEYFAFIYKLASTLKGKNGIIYLNSIDLNRLPSDFITNINNSELNAQLSDEKVDIIGGFILKNGDIEENMSFDALIMSKRDELEDMINRELFK